MQLLPFAARLGALTALVAALSKPPGAGLASAPVGAAPVAVAPAASFAARPAAAPAPAGTLLVVDTADDAIAFIDPVALRAETTIAVGSAPHEIAVAADGRFAYVSNYGDAEDPGRTISVVDVRARRVVSTIALDDYRRPHGLALTRDGRRLFVTVESNQAVLEIDTAGERISRALATGQRRSRMPVLAADEGTLYVANAGSGSMSAIRLRDGALSRVVVGEEPEGLALSPDGRFLWVANRSDGTVTVVAVAGDSVVDTLVAGGAPVRVAFTPDGRRALVANAQSNDIAIFDARQRRLVARVSTGEMPAGLLVEPDGRHAWVAESRRDRLTRIDLATLKEAGHVIPGRGPEGLGWAPAAGTSRPAAALPRTEAPAAPTGGPRVLTEVAAADNGRAVWYGHELRPPYAFKIERRTRALYINDLPIRADADSLAGPLPDSLDYARSDTLALAYARRLARLLHEGGAVFFGDGEIAVPAASRSEVDAEIRRSRDGHPAAGPAVLTPKILEQIRHPPPYRRLLRPSR